MGSLEGMIGRNVILSCNGAAIDAVVVGWYVKRITEKYGADHGLYVLSRDGRIHRAELSEVSVVA